MYLKQMILYSLRRLKTRGSQKQEALLNSVWQGTYNHDENLEKISLYHHEKIKHHKTEQVDSTTWTDLNMDLVFQKLNHCSSTAGRQYLYHLLHQYQIDSNVFNNSESGYLRFIQDVSLRKKIQKKLLCFNQNNAYQLVKLFLSDLPSKPKGHQLIYILSLSLLLTIAGISHIPELFFVATGLALTNLMIHKVFMLKIVEFIPDMNALNRMLRIAKQLIRIKATEPVFQMQNIQSQKSVIDEINKKTDWLLIDPTKTPELLAILIEYCNSFFLLNIINFLNSIATIKKHQKELLFILVLC